MKKNLFFCLMFISALGLFSGCSDDDDKDKEPITVTGQNFDIDNTVNITDPSKAVVVVNIEANSGIQNLIVSIKSPALDDNELGTIGLSGEFDLANPGDLIKTLETLELISPNAPIKEAKSTKFDVSKFMPMLAIFDMKGPHKFHLTIKDSEGNSSKKILSIYFPNLKN